MKYLNIIIVFIVCSGAAIMFLFNRDEVEEIDADRAKALEFRTKESRDQGLPEEISRKHHSRELAPPAQYSEGARRAKEQTERMRDAGMLAKKGAPNYVMIGQNGKITNQAILQAGISEEQADEIQSVINRHWKKMSDSLADRATLVESDSDPENGLYAFFIPALPDGGSDAVKFFENDVRLITGNRAGTTLLKSFSPGSYVGGFGKFEIRMKVSSNASNERITEFEFLHPETGITVRKGSFSQNYSYQYFGDLLENPKFTAHFHRPED